MKKNNKILLGAIITIAACGAAVAGSTYALFTSEAKTNVAVTAGTVDVVTEVSEVKTYSGEWDAATGAYVEKETTTQGTFTNGGTVKVVGSDIILDKISPMDKVTFKLTTKNKSNIDVQYRSKLMCDEGAELFTGLEMTMDGVKYEGVTTISAWEQLAVGSEDKVVEVSITMPEAAGNQYQGKSTKISITSEAVQGNANVENLSDTVVGIYTPADLLKVAANVNSNVTMYSGKTVELMNDIDMSGIDFPGIGYTVANYPSCTFKGIFDGKSHTIDNLSIDVSDSDDANQSAGLFGTACGATIKDFTLDHANIVSAHYAGAVVGYSSFTGGINEITNVKVKNSSVKSTPKLFGGSMDNGDKIGGILGYSAVADVIDSCSFEGGSVTAYRDLGGIAGCCNKTVIKNCSVKDATITQDNTNAYKTSIDTYHEILGRDLGAVLENNTYENVTLATK